MGLSVLSGTIWDYQGLSETIRGYLRLSGTMLEYLGVRCKKKQERACYCYFKTFSLFLFLLFLPERFLEELALLKIDGSFPARSGPNPPTPLSRKILKNETHAIKQ